VKRLFIFLFLGIFLISFTSAITWDNEAYWDLQNTSITDLTGNGNDGTNYGGVSIAGIIDNGLNFSGTPNFVAINKTATQLGINGANTRTINIWAKIHSEDNNGVLLGLGTRATEEYFSIAHLSTTNNFRFGTFGNDLDITETGWAGNWKMFTSVYNGTHIEAYVNGVFKGRLSATLDTGDDDTMEIARGTYGSGYLKGVVDEIGIWSRALTETEIEDLYNGGAGVEFEEGGLKIDLVSPENGITLSDIGTDFRITGSNLSSVSGTWENLTYQIWQNGTLFNESTISLTGETFNESLFIDEFTFNDYTWNGIACYTNITGDFCLTALENRTFEVSLFTIVSEDYSLQTLSGTLENFSISIDILEGYSLEDAIFVYNGSSETPSIIAEGDNRYLLVSDYPIPIVSANENLTFYWNLEFDNETINTDERTQEVYAISLDTCGVYTNKLFNISLFDEKTTTPLLGDIEIIFNVLNRPDYTIIKTINFSVSNMSSTEICSGLNLSGENLAYSTEIRYTSEGYSSEFYNIQRQNLPSSTSMINLYLLNLTDSTEFKIIYQDSTFNFVEGAIIQLQRKYLGEDLYRVVEAPITSSDGTSILHIDLDSVKYRITVVKNGVVLDEFENLVFKCQSELTGECEQKLLGEIDPQNERELSDVLDFYYSEPVLSNNTITVSFSIPSGNPASVRLILEQKDEYSNKTLCNTSITSSAGLISCDYSESLGRSYIDLFLYKDGEPMAIKTYIIDGDSSLDWLNNNYIFVIVILFSLVGMALSSPEWIIINGVITMLFSGALFLLNGLDFAMGLGSLVWLVISSIILISKISKQEDR